jgi:hypothetical protein
MKQSDNSAGCASNSASTYRFDIPSRLFSVALLTVFLVSVFKGFRLPGSWAVTQLTINYSHGFMRRGLVGELIRHLGGAYAFHYNMLMAVSFLFFFAAVIGTAFMIRRICRQKMPVLDYQLAALVFAASPAIVLFANIIGYMDILGYALTVPFIVFAARQCPGRDAIYLRRFGIFYIASLYAVVFALVHEGFVVMFFPLIVLALLCHGIRQAATHPFTRRDWGLFVAYFLLVLGVLCAASVMVSRFGTQPLEKIMATRQAVAASANFELCGGVYGTLVRNPKENLFSLMPPYLEKPSHLLAILRSFVQMAPGFFFLLCFGVSLIARLDRSTIIMKVVLVMAFVGASILPLSLNFVGWDIPRWNALAVLSSFGGVSILSLFFSSPQCAMLSQTPNRSALWSMLAVVAIVLGIAGRTTMFDGEPVSYYPFEEDLAFLLKWVRSGFSYVPPRPF